MTDANGATNFTAAVRHQRPARSGSNVCHGRRRHQRSGDGRSDFLNFNVDAVEGDSIQLRLDACRRSAAAPRASPTSLPVRGLLAFTARSLSFSATRLSTRATISTTPRRLILAGFRPFAATSSDSPTAAPVILPHIYDGRRRTFYFTAVPGIPPGPGNHAGDACAHSDERAGLDTSTIRRRIRSMFPSIPAIAAILKRYPLPNYTAGSYGVHTYATPSNVITNANQFSLRIDHKFSAKDQFFARFTMDNLTGPTTNPDQTAIDPSFGVTYIDRQRNVVGTYTRAVSPRLTLVSLLSITRSTPGFPTPRLRRSRGQVRRWALRAVQRRRGYGDAGLRKPLPRPRNL